MQLFANDDFFFVGNSVGECKCSPGFKKKKKTTLRGCFRELFGHFHYAPNKLGCSPSIRWLHGELTCHKFSLWGWWQGRSQSSWKNKKNGTRFPSPYSLSPLPTPTHPLPSVLEHPGSLSYCLSLSPSALTRLSLSPSPPFLSMGKQVIMSCHRKVTH